jgi:hypothetical protein
MRSSSICYKIEVVFHFIKNDVVFPFQKIEVISQIGSYYIAIRLLGQVLLISSYFTTSPGAGGRVLDKSKLRLISAFKQSFI